MGNQIETADPPPVFAAAYRVIESPLPPDEACRALQQRLTPGSWFAPLTIAFGPPTYNGQVAGDHFEIWRILHWREFFGVHITGEVYPNGRGAQVVVQRSHMLFSPALYIAVLSGLVILFWPLFTGSDVAWWALDLNRVLPVALLLLVGAVSAVFAYKAVVRQ